MRFMYKTAKNEWFITPCVGVINECQYYGYPVIAIAFAWLRWRCKIEIGVKRYKADKHDKR